MKILFTGAMGFIAGYAIDELLKNGHEVVGIDNYSKYGRVSRSYAEHPNFTFVEGDVKDIGLLKECLLGCDSIIAGAAMIGGISYFHKFAYDLLAENERIIAATFDAALWAFQSSRLQKIVVISSSMVFESADQFPSQEGSQFSIPPPASTYGFQKLSTEYFAKGAWEQYSLPFTIVRPFNCIGVGETKSLGDSYALPGNNELALSHVVPDLTRRIIRSSAPVTILGEGNQVRHYTYGGDLAVGIRLCLELPQALNEDFNISTTVGTSVLELARLIWMKVRPAEPFEYVSLRPYQHDVQKRFPDTRKAKALLKFEALTSLETSLDEVIPWVKEQVESGRI